jgi:hypothetical protein
MDLQAFSPLQNGVCPSLRTNVRLGSTLTVVFIFDIQEFIHPWNTNILPKKKSYKWVALQVRGVSNLVMSPAGLGPENDCSGEDQQQL